MRLSLYFGAVTTRLSNGSIGTMPAIISDLSLERAVQRMTQFATQQRDIKQIISAGGYKLSDDLYYADDRFIDILHAVASRNEAYLTHILQLYIKAKNNVAS